VTRKPRVQLKTSSFSLQKSGLWYCALPPPPLNRLLPKLESDSPSHSSIADIPPRSSLSLSLYLSLSFQQNHGGFAQHQTEQKSHRIFILLLKMSYSQ
jgi:hypothetical protein